MLGMSHPVQLHVEATGVAHRLPLCVPSPQGGGGGVAVGAGQAHPPRGRLRNKTSHTRWLGKRLNDEIEVVVIGESRSVTHQPSLRFNQRSVDAVHFVVQSAGVTQVVAGTISPPEGRRHGPAVDTLSAFSKVIE